MNAELTAENRPAWMPQGSVIGRELDSDATHKDKGSVQVIVVLLDIVAIKLFRFLAVYGKEVGARVIGPQWSEEFFEGRPEAVTWVIVYVLAIAEQGVRTTLNQAGSLQAVGSLLEVVTEVVPSLVTTGWERGTQ